MSHAYNGTIYMMRKAAIYIWTIKKFIFFALLIPLHNIYPN